MIRLGPEKEKLTVWQDRCVIGTAALYDNPCHMGNCYVQLELDRYDTSASTELFRLLQERAGRPLQAMVSSDDRELVRFLTSGGFSCKRKCYEVEASAEDYTGKALTLPMSKCSRGERAYDRCCEMLYEHYLETHRDINPWTAGYEVFLGNLPDTVIYRENGGTVTALAFVEGNEIAYVMGTDEEAFAAFVSSVISWMFGQYQTIVFECDDCDWAAMVMKRLFTNQEDTSFDTYVYD